MEDNLFGPDPEHGIDEINEKLLQLEAEGDYLCETYDEDLYTVLGHFIKKNGCDDGKLTLRNAWEYKHKLSEHEQQEIKEKAAVRHNKRHSDHSNRSEYFFQPILQDSYHLQYMKALNEKSILMSPEIEMAEKADLEPIETKLSDESMAKFIMAEKAEMYGWTFWKHGQHDEYFWAQENFKRLEEFEETLSDDEIGVAHQKAFLAIATDDEWTHDCFDFLRLPQKQKFLGVHKWSLPSISKIIEQEWTCFAFQHSITMEECFSQYTTDEFFSNNFSDFIKVVENKLSKHGWDSNNKIIRSVLQYKMMDMLWHCITTREGFANLYFFDMVEKKFSQHGWDIHNEMIEHILSRTCISG